MAVQHKIVKGYRNSREHLNVHETEYQVFEARMATSLIERWGMVVGIPDGEDSTGRARMGLMSPAEVVSRACDTAELAIKAYRSRGWIVELPSLDKILAGGEDDE